MYIYTLSKYQYVRGGCVWDSPDGPVCSWLGGEQLRCWMRRYGSRCFGELSRRMRNSELWIARSRGEDLHPIFLFCSDSKLPTHRSVSHLDFPNPFASFGAHLQKSRGTLQTNSTYPAWHASVAAPRRRSHGGLRGPGDCSGDTGETVQQNRTLDILASLLVTCAVFWHIQIQYRNHSTSESWRRSAQSLRFSPVAAELKVASVSLPQRPGLTPTVFAKAKESFIGNA